MGIFVNTLGLNSYEESARNSSLDPTMELSLQNVLESEMNWNATMQAIYLDELAYKAQTGEDKIYSVNEASSVLESIKNFFQKLWAKIKALFERFVAMFNSYAKSDSAFVSKYTTTLRKLSLKDFRCDVFEFTHLNDDVPRAELNKALVKSQTGNTKISDLIDDSTGVLNDSKINSFVDGASDKADAEKLAEQKAVVNAICKDLEKTKALNYLRGMVLSDGEKSVSSSDFNKKLFKHFRKGKETAKSTKITSVEPYLKQIADTADVKDKAKDNYDEFKDLLEDNIDKLDNLEDTFSAEGEENTLKLRLTTKVSNYLRAGIGILETWNGAQLKAIKDCNRQAKTVCVKALTNGRKNEISTKYESADLFDEGESFLSRVELI